jgi:hypothetical protein
MLVWAQFRLMSQPDVPPLAMIALICGGLVRGGERAIVLRAF